MDELRGLDLISMMLYHGMWDLVWIYGVNISWYRGTLGYLWQQSICWVFIILSGFCLPLGHRPLRRGAIVFAGGALVTIVTMLFMPADLILCGVLTFLGSAMILTALLRPILDRVPSAVGLTASAMLFAFTYKINSGTLAFGLRLPRVLFRNLFTAWLGFPAWNFYSTDYFSILPWIFLFWGGYYLNHILGREGLEPLRSSFCPALGWLGRHSLLLYLLHQPVIYGVLTVVFAIIR